MEKLPIALKRSQVYKNMGTLGMSYYLKSLINSGLFDISYHEEYLGVHRGFRATIIHYKGESTKKGSINYVVLFYNAMIIFAKKHFSKKNASFFSLLINIAIYFRAVFAILRRSVISTINPILNI